MRSEEELSSKSKMSANVLLKQLNKENRSDKRP
jgi:hypothetical protein